MPKKSIVIYGPPGRGKSKNAEKIRAAFGLDRVVYEWDGKQFEDEGVLYLTNVRATEIDLHVRHRRAFTYEAAMVAVGSMTS